MLVEIIATSLEEAILAEQYGADRIELIHGFELGGLSPSRDIIKSVSENVLVPVNVMVRPHGESFIFSNSDMKQVFHEIDYIASNTSINAIVFGTLDINGNINFNQLNDVLKLLEQTKLEMTFHRAIDESNDAFESFRSLVSNCDGTKLTRVLTSGGYSSAFDGYSKISKMCKASSDSSINVLAGAGINPHNAKDLIKLTGVSEIHLGTGVRVGGELCKDLFNKLFINLK